MLRSGRNHATESIMSTRIARRVVLCAILAASLITTGKVLHAHHAVAGVYDLNKEIVLEGRLKKLNFTNPHASIELSVPDKKTGKVTDCQVTSSSGSSRSTARGSRRRAAPSPAALRRSKRSRTRARCWSSPPTSGPTSPSR